MFNLVLTPYLLPDSLTAAVGLVLGVLLLKNTRDVPGRVMFGLFLLAVSFWAFCDIVSVAVQDLNLKILFVKGEYVAIIAVPVLALQFIADSVQFSASKRRLWLKILPSFWLIPILSWVFLWLSPGLTLFWDRPHELTLYPGTVVVRWSYGPWYLVHVLYSYTLLLAAAFLWVLSFFKRRQKFGWPEISVLVALFVPFAANFLYMVDRVALPLMDPTVPFLTITALLMFFNLHRFRFLEILPVSKEHLLENWGVPTFVFDRRGRLAYCNRDARLRWNLDGRVIGLIRPKIPGLSWLPSMPQGPEISTTDVIATGNGSFEAWEAREKLLYRGRRSAGSVLTLHNITALRESQRALRTLNTDLEERVRERTQDLQEANRRLSEELSQRRQAERLTFYYSLHDPLTGLGNRSYLLSRLGQAVERSRRDEQARFGLIFLNFNGFKEVNESFGHQAGDEFLRLCANRLKETLRNIDTAARYAGDAFVILLDGVATQDEIQLVASRLTATLESPVMVQGRDVVPSVRLGLLLGSPGYASAEEALSDAEIACQQALVAGVPQLFFQERLRDDVKGRWKLRDELGRAIVNGDLVLHYQPIVQLSTREIAGWEVLARWQHPQKGLLSPNLFIPVAEETGMIHPLGLWVLRESAKTFKTLLDEFPWCENKFLAVNVSPKQLAQPDFPEIILGVWEREGLKPEVLAIEITEGALIENSEEVIPTLEKLRRAGVGIKLDDFGTGYSSLHYLHRLPVDTLKVDRSFVTDLVAHDQPQTVAVADSIVRSILRLAEELKIDVIAEGIETEEQWEILARYGCPYGQGFLFSEGQPATQLKAWMETCRDRQEKS